MKYQLRMFYADAMSQTAGSKATRDCSEILSSMGYRNHDVPILGSKSRFWNFMTLLKRLVKLYGLLEPGDQVLVQYPLLGINKWLKYITWLLHVRNCKLICLLHDLDSLRNMHHTWTLNTEINRLNTFDLLIVHNHKMKRLLQENGLHVQMCCLELFDYLVPKAVWNTLCIKPNPQSTAVFPQQFNRVAFAGSLTKSAFLKDLCGVPGISFKLYGPGFEHHPATVGMEWAGSFDADQLPARLNADFGLVWDGDSIDCCSGALGNYLQINNPHKASLYLLAGLPLIAPRTSAIGDFISANGVGITLDSLYQLPEILQDITTGDYLKMKTAIAPISVELMSGMFLRKALKGT